MMRGFFRNRMRSIKNRLPDSWFLRLKYRKVMGTRLDLKDPKTLNEKLQWLKLYDRNPLYTTMVDKVAAKEYVAAKIGWEHIIPTLGVWEHPSQIAWDALPERFVLKCNHNSGLGMQICKDKSALDVQEVSQALEEGLKQDYYRTNREWPYKNVPRKILAERFMDNDGQELADYKVHCFNGVPQLILVCQDRFSAKGLTEDFFSAGWEHLPVRRPKHPNASVPPPCPEQLEEMLAFAQQLAKDVPFLRVDFYIIAKTVYFSELTFFPASGFERFAPESWDAVFGRWLTLPESQACRGNG